jgi:hypothetical protein
MKLSVWMGRMDFEVGDFAIIRDKDEPNTPYHRLIISTYSDERRLSIVDNEKFLKVLELSSKFFQAGDGATNFGAPHWYEKIPPTRKLVCTAIIELEAALDKKRIDNLTYIEILAKLREYEQSL